MRERRLYGVLAVPGALWLLGLLGGGLGLLVAMSLGTTDDFGEAQLGSSGDNFAEALDAFYLPILGRSVLYAGLTVALCLLLGFPIAYLIAMHGGRYKGALIAALVLPFLVSYLVRSYAWVTLLADQGVLNGIVGTEAQFLNRPAAVVGGLVNGFIVFMILPIYASLDRLDRSVVEAAQDLYASRWRAFWHVILPSARPGVLAGCLLVLIPSLGDFVAAQFFGGPSTLMIGGVIQEQFREANDWPFGAALTVILVGLVLLALIPYLRSAGRERVA